MSVTSPPTIDDPHQLLRITERSSLSLQYAFTDSSGDASTPGAVAWLLLDPDGATVASDSETPAATLTITLPASAHTVAAARRARVTPGELRDLIVTTDAGDDAVKQTFFYRYWIDYVRAP
jgi:hypothetical protein